MVDDGPFRLRWGHRRCPLRKAYDLSFVRLTEFDCIWVAAEGPQGRLGIGEAVPLTGYNWETLDTIRSAVMTVTGDGEWMERAEIERRCRALAPAHPFAVSAVMSAIDMPAALRQMKAGQAFAVSAPVSADSSHPQLRASVEAALNSGYRYIKCKVGRNLEQDIAAARLLLTEQFSASFRVVFDANQAYSDDAAMRFADALMDDVGRLQWFEQPVDRGDWRAMERICRRSPAPIVLDESIYGQDDIRRAADLGAFGVKLKLMKHLGLTDSLMLAQAAKTAGLMVVFGNGVATDIGNLCEYLVLSLSGDFVSPSESTGFLKLESPLLDDILQIDAKGAMTCTADAQGIAAAIGRFACQSAI